MPDAVIFTDDIASLEALLTAREEALAASDATLVQSQTSVLGQLFLMRDALAFKTSPSREIKFSRATQT